MQDKRHTKNSQSSLSKQLCGRKTEIATATQLKSHGRNNYPRLTSRFTDNHLVTATVIRVVKTKSTKDISMGMFSLFCCGVFLWFVYGLFTNHMPIILANSFAFLQALIILVYKVKYK